MIFRKKMSVRHNYSVTDGWIKEHVCKVQMRVWIFWVDVKVIADDDEDYVKNCADEVVGYLIGKV